MTDADDVARSILGDMPLLEAPVSPVTFDGDLFQRLMDAYTEHRAKYRPLDEFKVTQEQFDELLTLVPKSDEPCPPAARMFGIPVRLVDTLEESTVYERWLEKYVEEMREWYDEKLRESLAVHTPWRPGNVFPFSIDPMRLVWPAPTVLINFAEPRPCPVCGESTTGVEYDDVAISMKTEVVGGCVTTLDTTLTSQAANAKPCGCKLHANEEQL